MLNSRPPFAPRLRWITLGTSIVASLLAFGVGATSARADVPLTRADIEAVLNRVELIPRNRSARAARLTDFMAVGDTLRTAAQSRAQLRFNDGSLARVGERATFRFIPNTRNFRLSDGTMLLLIPPGRGRSIIQTPSAITGIQGSAVVVRHIEDRNLTIVMALTNNPAGPMTVTTSNCATAEAEGCVAEHALYAGQMALVQNNQVQILEFDLPTFYQTSPLIDGLELNNPDADVSLGPVLDQVRAETLEALSRESVFSDATVLNPVAFSLEATDQSLLDQPWLLSPVLAETDSLGRTRTGLPPAGTLVGVPRVNQPSGTVAANPAPQPPITSGPQPISRPIPVNEPQPVSRPTPAPTVPVTSPVQPTPVVTPTPVQPTPVATPTPVQPTPVATPSPIPETPVVTPTPVPETPVPEPPVIPTNPDPGNNPSGPPIEVPASPPPFVENPNLPDVPAEPPAEPPVIFEPPVK